MARSMTNATPTISAATFCGDFRGREQLLPGGVKLDAAQWAADAAGRKPIAAGTVIGRTIAERDLGTPFGVIDAAGGDAEVYIIAFDVTDAADINDAEVLRPFSGVLIYENFLPGWAGLAAPVQAQIRARFVCVRGAQ